MMTTLRQRMIDAMVLRGFRPRTQVSYLRAVSQMARHYRRSPELITDQEVQAYLLHLVRDRQLARTSVNQVSSATRFLICEVLGQADRRSRIPMALTPQRLPEVLSRAEVAAVLAAPISLKARTLLMTAYATGMRVSELCNLRGCDIDSSPDRMCIRVVAGKGGHDRYSLLTPELLEQLRLYWRQCRRHARPEDWLFPARLDPSNALDTRSAARYFYFARNVAGIDKVGGIHTLRHYSASRNMPSDLGRLRNSRGMRNILSLVRSAYSLASERLEEGEQLVVRLESASTGRLRLDLVEGCLLDLEIGVEIDLRRLDRLMPQQQGNHGGLHAGLEQFHRCRVAQHMRGHVLVLERWAAPASLFNMLGQHVVHAIRAQTSAACAWKDDRVLPDGDFAQPGLHDSGRLLGQWRRAFLATLADDMHMSSRAKTNRVPAQAGDFRDAQPSLDCHQYERMVAPPRPSMKIGRTQNGADLLSREEPDLCSRAALVRNGQDPLDLRGVSWHLEGRIPKERSDGGQSQVAAGRTDAPAGLHVVEKRRHQRCIDLLELQPLRCNAEMLLRELQQQPEAVAVRADGVGTGLTLLHQPAREKALQQRRECGRGHVLPSQRRSMRSTASRMSCGWALRYQ
jgi:integrase/recombinase XerD